MSATATLPDLISNAQTTEEQFLRQIFVRDQMAEWSKKPLIMERADGSLTEEETRRLRNMERLLQRLESGPNRLESGPNLPLGLPPPAAPAVKPSNPDDSVKSK